MGRPKIGAVFLLVGECNNPPHDGKPYAACSTYASRQPCKSSTTWRANDGSVAWPTEHAN